MKLGRSKEKKARGPRPSDRNEKAAGTNAHAAQPPSYGVGFVDDALAPTPAADRGAGTALHGAARNKMEAAFGTDLSSVRVHEEPRATALGARAYARGADLYFAPGQYQPQSLEGQELLGHELAHALQQSQGRVPTTARAGGLRVNDDPSLEREADVMGARAARGERVAGMDGGGALGGLAGVGGSLRAPVQMKKRHDLGELKVYTYDRRVLGYNVMRVMDHTFKVEDQIVKESTGQKYAKKASKAALNQAQKLAGKVPMAGPIIKYAIGKVSDLLSENEDINKQYAQNARMTMAQILETAAKKIAVYHAAMMTVFGESLALSADAVSDIRILVQGSIDEAAKYQAALFKHSKTDVGSSKIVDEMNESESKINKYLGAVVKILSKRDSWVSFVYRESHKKSGEVALKEFYGLVGKELYKGPFGEAYKTQKAIEIYEATGNEKKTFEE